MLINWDVDFEVTEMDGETIHGVKFTGRKTVEVLIQVLCQNAAIDTGVVSSYGSVGKGK